MPPAPPSAVRPHTHLLWPPMRGRPCGGRGKTHEAGNRMMHLLCNIRAHPCTGEDIPFPMRVQAPAAPLAIVAANAAPPPTAPACTTTTPTTRAAVSLRSISLELPALTGCQHDSRRIVSSLLYRKARWHHLCGNGGLSRNHTAIGVALYVQWRAMCCVLSGCSGDLQVLWAVLGTAAASAAPGSARTSLAPAIMSASTRQHVRSVS